MGLLQKAVSVSPGKGLLRKSLDILRGSEAGPSILVTQEEVDELLANRKSETPVYRKPEIVVPPKVPLTWSDAGITAPSARGPTIDDAEFRRIHGGKKTERVVARSRAPEKTLQDAYEVPTPPPPPVDPTEEIISRIFALAPGVELPSRMFGILKARLSITKGALLLFDPIRLVYAPWASTGYDTTSLHRLRIPRGATEGFTSVASGRAIIIKGMEQIAHYEKYFSNREHAFIERIILAPVISDETLIAVLLITAASPPLPSENSLLSSLERIAGAAAPVIQKSREEKLKRGTVSAEMIRAPSKEELTRLLSSPSWSKKSILFISLTLADYEKQFLSMVPDMDPFRLDEDMRHFLRSFTADLGCAIPLGSAKYLVGLQDIEKKDLDIFLHQLTVYLNTIFGEIEGDGVLGMGAIQKVRQFPGEGEGITELAAFFSN
jgi:hypothetical protein